eukprot:Plantae.Rhodophyta-Rhodochaete_pulchella.ctg48992.p1 GENE.Plantae.Rhodophyta-Rhodochaete_pulchella.ctg48992~~Plantae.Rhodophyta-Rhodochaete_pulchella.ctg48992.p1  ORF type:complete len:105 (-),score=9.32 Plantae.Rhodophyta-Rhodochaete_pulchella.ctg48992:2-316(-)
MHMARLHDTSRPSYSLENLSVDCDRKKSTMKDRFGSFRILKDNSKGKEKIVPAPEQIQRSEDQIAEWVEYSAEDAEVSCFLTETSLALHARSLPSPVLASYTHL